LQGRSDECKIERQKNGKVREREEEEGRRVFFAHAISPTQSDSPTAHPPLLFFGRKTAADPLLFPPTMIFIFWEQVVYLGTMRWIMDRILC
jgi:hypothetical protein